ncbi:uncharacterized protein LOC127835070 isoform X3 [Dreissena polymorpha]|uniref:uncharacterized protein LOC127835070 isoform X2 n=1 Tax=Dreissena polymorpha TaxID=45954 RepID=UPI00226519C0|nr:uncharacterized protein LOC127835070 isoform X2 [Dreissena polymorpha]XP_052217277.1 uncharacterized protein LOC127835070 isoform X3 [Dreissena polymorpha]
MEGEDVTWDTVVIPGVEDTLSLEVIQHQPVKLLFQSHNARDTIQAELLHSGCKSGVPCSRLGHSVLHNGAQSFLTFSVHPANEGSSILLKVAWVLLLTLLSVLLIWMIRKSWMKRKIKPRGDVPGKDGSTHCTGDPKPRDCLNNLICAADNVPSLASKSGAEAVNSQMIPDAKSLDTTRLHSTMSWTPYLVILSLAGMMCVLLVMNPFTTGIADDSIPTLRISVPQEKHIRHVRSYATDPSLRDVQIGTESSSVFVTRLQLLDLSKDCRNNLTQCRVHALCSSQGPGLGMQCRCNRGFYLKDLLCVPCRTSCDDGFYMTEQCSMETDVVCKPCSHCSGSTYEAAACTTTQDTICIDVTFPLRQFEAKMASLRADLVTVNVSMSRNLFMERLDGIKKLEESIYLSSNKQALGFVWVRPESGLTITIRASEIFLIPEYADINYIDDEKFINGSGSMDVKEQMASIRKNNCRHPLPDEYDLNMLVGNDLASVAREIVCDSQNTNLPRCPSDYKDGDKYVAQIFSKPCSKVPEKAEHAQFKTISTNTIQCPGNSEIAKEIFNKRYADPAYLTFPPEECKSNMETCGRCLTKQACISGSNETDCCNLQCHASSECQQFYSEQCPAPDIECSRGTIVRIGIVPRFEHIMDEFSCHLRHHPPTALYRFSYETTVPWLNFSFGSRVKEVPYKNFTDFMHGFEEEAFIRMNHFTESRYDDEVILKGSFKHQDPRKAENFTLHKMKNINDLRRSPFTISSSTTKLFTKIQFERPFQHSTLTWIEGGCDKNLSQILPSQPIYEDYGKTVQPPEKRMDNGQFVYQIMSKDELPHIRFSIPENTSVMSFYKDRYGDSKMNPWSLNGELSWIKQMQSWNITLTGSVTICPGLFTLEVFLEATSERVANYDILVACPKDFSTTFILRCNSVNVVDVFSVVINDSSTSHKIVLSSVQGPQYFVDSQSYAETSQISESAPWLFLLAIVAICFCIAVFLLMFYVKCNKNKPKTTVTDIPVPKPDLGPQMTLLKSIDKIEEIKESKKTKLIKLVLTVLYVTYAVIFSFCATFGIFHALQQHQINEVGVAVNVSSHVKALLQVSLDEIVRKETDQVQQMLDKIGKRMHACSNHLKSSFNYSSPQNVNENLSNTMKLIFNNSSGIVKEKLRDYSRKRLIVYQRGMTKFLNEFNKTLDKNLKSIQIKYASYLQSVATNKWFKFPQQLFMEQQLLQRNPLNKVTDNLAAFLTWLEIDKVQEIFEIKKMLMERVTSMLPTLDFSMLEDVGEISGIQQNPEEDYFVNLKPSANFFKFYFSEQESSLRFNSEPANGNENTMATEDDNSVLRIRSVILPLFVGVFVLLDICLLVYRSSWLIQSWYAFKHGLDDRIPCDTLTKKLHFILTGKDIPKPENVWEDGYDHIRRMKDKNFWGGDSRKYFEYCRGSDQERKDILNELCAKSQQLAPVNNMSNKGCFHIYGLKVLKHSYSLFMSVVFWRLVLMCAFVLLLCLIAKVTHDLVTMESAIFLLDIDAMQPLLDRQSDISLQVVEQFVEYLNEFLVVYKNSIDGEVQTINNILVQVAERQQLLLNTVITDMCNLAGSESCDFGTNLVTLSITSCNFLPLHAHLSPGVQSEMFLDAVKAELSPLVLNLRDIIFNSVYLLLISACLMIICQIAARVIFVYLRNSNHLKLTKLYQLPSVCSEMDGSSRYRGGNEDEKQSNVAESCESGVYDLTN